MIENLKNLLNSKNLLIITVSLIICYIFFNIFLYENFGEEDTTVSATVSPINFKLKKLFDRPNEQWALNDQTPSRIYKCSKPCTNNNWTKIHSQDFLDLAFDDKYVYGINNGIDKKRTYKCTNTTTEPCIGNWINVTKKEPSVRSKFPAII